MMPAARTPECFGLACALLAAACGGSGGAPGSRIQRPQMPVALEFTVQPAGGKAGTTLPALQVTVLDAQGNKVATATVAVELRLIATGGARLLGTVVATSVAGVATFDDLRVDRPAGQLALHASAGNLRAATSRSFEVVPKKRHAILLIADGWGYKHVEATRLYTKLAPVYDGWMRWAMSTWDETTRLALGGTGYDPAKTWSEFGHTIKAATDSGASATAMFTGQKTDVANISVAKNDAARLPMLGELATAGGFGSGAVTTVPISHATPGAWIAHNSDRSHSYAITDEGLFGHPNTTGDKTIDVRWDGHWGPTRPGADVVIGAGHPSWFPDQFLNAGMLRKLRDENGRPGRWTLVERIDQRADGGQRLLAAAADPNVERLLGLFGGAGGNLEFRKVDGTGRNPENPTLAEMTRAALLVLQRKPEGFALMIEGGAVDWASHGGAMNEMLGEMIGFDAAARAVVEWVEDPSNGSSWLDTVVIVTGDHETGYLTQAPNVFPNEPLGEVSPRTLALEKAYDLSLRRASWGDTNSNDRIDPGETVYWAWNSVGHSNTLIPLYVKGYVAGELARHVVATDPVRGRWVDNTAVSDVMLRALGLR